MTREELIEKVARALCRNDITNEDEYWLSKTRMSEDEAVSLRWESYKQDAIAAIDIVLEEVERRTDIASLGCSKDAADRIRSTIRELRND